MREENMKNSTEQKMYIPTYGDVLVAHERIKPYIHETPILT
jgi:threonine dehydratase